ncbi:AbiJ-NTD4 domain-containing protein [Pedobacter sp. SYP-B3415]|uniref:AbiJ-NTD4 domain-containing protein n=1 Tax=Pedobacter sp. SYP-B3415 TaxID=2496641 RepID=UPI0013ED3FAF|nr:hypothetical protein [Pedobacter sp. SYP-B3415]
MTRFSQRMGIVPMSKVLQVDSMDNDLRNSLWNIFDVLVVRKIKPSGYSESAKWTKLRVNWIMHFEKKILSSQSTEPSSFEWEMKNVFIKGEWWKVYDAIQFMIDIGSISSDEIHYYNTILERESSAYRIIDNLIVPITNETEIGTIETASTIGDLNQDIAGVSVHLRKALSELSNKTAVDYALVIRESISAVETIVKAITSENTLGAGLRKIEHRGITINSQLKESFNKVYAYSNDPEAGIRHAVMSGHQPADFETAKYLLVTCSAFINYLYGISQKAGMFNSNSSQ